MAKKPARKQAPPKPGESIVREADAGEPTVESLVAALAGAGEREPAEGAPAEEAPAEEPPSEEAPSEEAPGEEAPGEAAPVADAESEPGDEAPASGEGVKIVDSLPIDPDDDLSEVEGEASLRLVSIVESLLFASSKPLRVKQLRKVLHEPSIRQIQLALKHLIAQNEERGIIVAQVAGGFVLQTSPKNATWVQTLLQAKPVRLSRPQLETLAVVAYRQPVTRPEIDHIRGVDSGAVLKLLLERELIQIVGKKDEPGRPLMFGTTVGFLEFFNLMSLRDLPDLREFRELSEESKATLRKNMADEEIEALGQEVLQFARPEGEGEESETSESETESESEAESEAEAEEAESESESESETEEESDAEEESESEADKEPEAESEPEEEPEADEEPEEESESEADEEPEAESEPDAEEPDADEDPEADDEPEPETDEDV